VSLLEHTSEFVQFLDDSFDEFAVLAVYYANRSKTGAFDTTSGWLVDFAVINNVISGQATELWLSKVRNSYLVLGELLVGRGGPSFVPHWMDTRGQELYTM
jgi:hypothetical protein